MEKNMFNPGDLVHLKQELTNKPRMIVQSVDKVTSAGEQMRLLGITCLWYDYDGHVNTYRFSSKDLLHVEL